MSITIVTRAGKGSPLNATEHDANLENIAAAIENTSTGHDHDGTDSKKIAVGNLDGTLPISQGGTGQVTAADAFSALKQAATTGATGVVELATQAEVLAGTDTSRAVVPADLWALLARSKNPLALAQAINMTYAASGSSGITVADNDNIDFGTGNFTLVWKGALPDWTPASPTQLMFKRSGSPGNYVGYNFWIGTNGRPYVTLYRNDSGTNFVCTATPSTTDNMLCDIGAIITRESTSADGSVLFTFNGNQIGDIVAIPAATPISLSNSEPLYVSGTSITRNASINKSALAFNRALTAAEVADLCDNDIADADRYGSQIPIYTSDFSAGVDGFTVGNTVLTGNVDGIAGEDNCLSIRADVTNTTHFALRANTFTPYKRVEISLRYYIPSTNTSVKRIGVRDTQHLTTYIVFGAELDAWGTLKWSTAAPTSSTGPEIDLYKAEDLSVFAGAGGSDDIVYIKEVRIKYLGVTAHYGPEGIQPAPGQWLDSSTNKNHAMQPAAGSSLALMKKDFEFRWTNTWTGSSAAQYIGGVNQAVLTPKHFKTEILCRAIETTSVQNIDVGDENDPDRYVAAATPSTTPTQLTLVNKINDGSHLKLVVTPAGSATMTLEFIVRGYLLE